MNPQERTERALRQKIEHAIYDAGFSEMRIHFLRQGLARLGPNALQELLLLVEELNERAHGDVREREQGRLW